jgi:uncharacterized lipoprotein YddW (UPF0748 family)
MWLAVALGSCSWSPEAIDDAPVRPPVETVEVGHRREFRGVWVATVANINWPSRPGLSPRAATDELQRLVDAAADAGFNALVFQVRPEGDALYRSSLEPWSRYLTGEMGRDPGFDPLAELVARAHARQVEVHAWFNPYRAKSSRGQPAVAPHVSVMSPNAVYPYGNLLWMDPGSPEVQRRTREVVLDVARRYDVDGIHFDDYFYPYPNGRAFPDGATYAAYQASGGTLSLADWRRHNVDVLVGSVAEGLRAEKAWVRFGISPFGIYRPGFPAGVTGFDPVANLYADPMRWVERGWVDYVAPQLYWRIDAPRQPYVPLLQWWATSARGRSHLFAGNFLAGMETAAWSVDEMRAQLEETRGAETLGATGNIFYHIGPILQNRDGIADLFRDELYAAPALTPPAAGQRPVPAAPVVVADGGGWRLVHADATPLRAYAVYRADGDAWTLDRLLPADATGLQLPVGRWAVSAVNRYGDESRGVVLGGGG